MSNALIPFIVALSGKVNVVTFLTGISYEKLNILHRWASYLCLCLAAVHTVPFIVTALKIAVLMDYMRNSTNLEVLKSVNPQN
ncbi:ferric reductase NAD binding domain-containing protein [Penicillium malachiteum]|nr:ferric reductase NAD binding domain-containing protein [Penicillium malachiteum]